MSGPDDKGVRIPFIDACLAGMTTPETVDNWVEVWHRGDIGGELHEALGMTREEYFNWVSAPSCLPLIIEIQRLRRNALEILRMQIDEFRQTRCVVLPFPARDANPPDRPLPFSGDAGLSGA